jgi:hypothetical protein
MVILQAATAARVVRTETTNLNLTKWSQECDTDTCKRSIYSLGQYRSLETPTWNKATLTNTRLTFTILASSFAVRSIAKRTHVPLLLFELSRINLSDYFLKLLTIFPGTN